MAKEYEKQKAIQRTVIKRHKSLADYLKSLTDAELMHIYHSSFFFDFKMHEYATKLQDEITRRGIVLKRVGKKINH